MSPRPSQLKWKIRQAQPSSRPVAVFSMTGGVDSDFDKADEFTEFVIEQIKGRGAI